MIKQYEDLETWAWTEAMGEFMARMNFKAKQIGMDSSTFVNPYGGCAFGWNETTCMDMLRLGIHAYSYPYIMDVMSSSGNVRIHVYGEHERDVDIDCSNDFDAVAKRVHGEDAVNPYEIWGGKGGGWSTGEHKTFAYIAFCRVYGKDIVAVVDNHTADRSVGRLYRLNAIIEILDICAKKIRGEDISGMKLKYADCGAAAFLPEHTSSVLLKKAPIELIFGQNENERFNPASMSKILMAITAFDIWGSNQEMYQIRDEDICNDSNYWAFPGDIESIEYGLYPILINSNGSNTMALARHCGEKILEEKRKFGVLPK